MRRSLFMLCLIPFLSGTLVSAHGDDDVRERNALSEAQRRGEILPLAEILEGLRDVAGERILEIEFEWENRLPVYEIYFIDDDGRRREILVDARSGKIIGHHDDD